MNPVLFAICLVALLCGLVILLARNTLTCALALLGVLLATAGIYGMLGEHMVATLQLIVYAGAIMVLFVFSIMLLNIKEEHNEVSLTSPVFLVGILCASLVAGVLVWAVSLHMDHDLFGKVLGPYTLARIAELGGNGRVLSHALFSEYYIAFEAVSIALLTAIVGAVVLAKRRID